MLGQDAYGLVLRVVMDSRGIYMARDRIESEKYAKPIIGNLKQFAVTMTKWQTLIPDERRPDIEAGMKSTREFIDFRAELVRLSRETTLRSKPDSRDHYNIFGQGGERLARGIQHPNCRSV
jgi:methyl-accepting chemotaxis protein